MTYKEIREQEQRDALAKFEREYKAAQEYNKLAMKMWDRMHKQEKCGKGYWSE